jgi:ABC-2 type transport system permease protein
VSSLARLYLQQFQTTLASMFQYRASLLIWMIGHVLEPLIYLIVWSAVAAASGGSVGGFTPGGFAAYYILLMMVNQITYTWIMYEYEYRIREGMLSFALLRPVHPIHSDIADNVSSKIVTLPIMVAIAVGMAFAFHVTLHPPLWVVLAFMPALFFAFLIRFLVEWTLAQVAFWTTRVSAVNQTYFLLLLFLSGQIAPLALLPAPLRLAAEILPFRWMVSFPIELLLGQQTPAGTLTGLGAQLAWLALSLLIMRRVWRSAVRVYEAVGS